MKKSRYLSNLDASYTLSAGGKYTTRKIPKWRYRHHDIVEYLEAFDDEDLASDSLSAG